jgi:predicted anti-sigma-YlaC factor YlaD
MRGDGSCERYWDLINDYHDGRLKGNKQRAVETHLAGCAHCRRALQEVAQLRRLISQEPAATPLPAFWERCLENAAAARTWRLPRLRLRKAVLGVALALAVALVGVPVLRQAVMPLVVTQASAQVELPDSEYFMQHAGFAAAQPLGPTSGNVLLSDRAAEKEDREQAGNAESVEPSDDADAPGPW